MSETRHGSALGPGAQIDDFLIEGVAGRGGMGVVYRARQGKPDRLVALKVIAADLAEDQAFRARFQREASIAAQIEHPNVIPVYAVGESGGLVYIVMRFVDGIDLRRLLAREGRLEPRRAAAIVDAAGQALDAAHARGLVHRDVKPANILISTVAGRDHVYLSDFGLSRQAEGSGGLTRTGAFLGTIDYVAPEQARGDRVDARADVYSLGCVLFQLLTGTVPFPLDNDLAKLYAHDQRPPPSPLDRAPDLPAAFKAVLARAMAKHPDGRYRSAGDLGRAAVEAAASGAGVATPAPPIAAGPPAPVELSPAPSTPPLPSALPPPDEPGAALAGGSSRGGLDSRPRDGGDPAAPVTRGVIPGTLDPRGARSPFVGRADEVARLLAVVRAGERKLIAVAGEPGVGKTRIAAEVARQAHAEGAVVLFGRCHEGPSAPYQPFVEALRQHVDRVGLDGIAPLAGHELARLLPELRTAAPDQPETADAGAARIRLFEGVIATLDVAARQRTVVLVLDDLHWADRPTLLLLAHLLRDPEQVPLIVVGTFRLDELGLGHPLRELLGGLEHERRVLRLTLDGLPDTAVRSIVATGIGTNPAPELVSWVVRQTSGNPFFVEEVARDLLESDALEGSGSGGAGLRASPSAPAVPISVRTVIRGRLERLGDAAARTLELAAVVGPEFSLEILERAGGLDRDALLDVLEAAEAAQLVRDVAGRSQRWAFSHALVRAAVYEELSGLRRARLHARVADALEATTGADPAVLAAEIAHHAFEARGVEGPERAVRAARVAAAAALAGLAYEEAAAHYARALSAIESDGGRAGHDRCQLLIALGEARARAADPAAAEAFAAASHAARELGDPELLALAALGRCGIGVEIIGLDAERVGGLEEALARLGDRAPALRVRLLARLAIELYYAPGRERSDPLSAEAVRIARTHGDPDALLAALNARHAALWTPAGLEDRLSIADEMVALAQASGRSEGELQGRNWRCVDLWESGAVARFETEAADHARLAGELRLPAYRWYEPLWRASLAALHGDWAQAELAATEARAAGTRAGDRNAGLFTWAIALWRHVCRREFDADLEFIEAQIRGSPASTAWRCQRCWYLAELGLVDRARNELDWLAVDDFGRIPSDANWLPAAYELTEAVGLLGDALRAAELHRLLLPYRDRNISAMRATFSFGSAEYALGRLAATAGRRDQAAAHYEAALETEGRWGARTWLVRTHARYAELLADRAAPGDLVAAGGHAREAVAAAAALDFPRFAVPARAAALAREAPGGSAA